MLLRESEEEEETVGEAEEERDIDDVGSRFKMSGGNLLVITENDTPTVDTRSALDGFDDEDRAAMDAAGTVKALPCARTGALFFIMAGAFALPPPPPIVNASVLLLKLLLLLRRPLSLCTGING